MVSQAQSIGRLGIEVWLDAGLKLLAAEGFSALTVDRVSAVVGRSKGSFYHHFGGADGFVDAILDHWRDVQTETIVQRVEILSDAVARREELRNQAIGLDRDVERAVRVWAGSDQRARAVIKEVDERRIEYLSKVINDVSPRSNEEALAAARLEYAALIGLFQLYPEEGPDFLGPLFGRLTDLITPDKDTNDRSHPSTDESDT